MERACRRSILSADQCDYKGMKVFSSNLERLCCEWYRGGGVGTVIFPTPTTIVSQPPGTPDVSTLTHIYDGLYHRDHHDAQKISLDSRHAALHTTLTFRLNAPCMRSCRLEMTPFGSQSPKLKEPALHCEYLWSMRLCKCVQVNERN